MDGTLVDSFQAIQSSVNFVRGAHGLVPLPLDQVRQAVGHGIHHLLRETCPTGDHQDNVALYLKHHPSVIKSQTRLLDGVESTLRRLIAGGVLLAVCSNKPVELTKQLLDELGMSGWFATVLGPESVGQPKPAPDMLLQAAADLNVSIDQALYVGDMPVDIETARAARMTVWVIASGTTSARDLAAAHPDRLLDRFDQLLELTG